MSIVSGIANKTTPLTIRSLIASIRVWIGNGVPRPDRILNEIIEWIGKAMEYWTQLGEWIHFGIECSSILFASLISEFGRPLIGTTHGQPPPGVCQCDASKAGGQRRN